MSLRTRYYFSLGAGSLFSDNALVVARHRALLCLCGIGFFFFVVGVALFRVMVFSGGSERVLYSEDYIPRMSAYRTKLRASIFDRNGENIAKNLRVASLVADPVKMLDIDDAVAKTLEVFSDLDEARLRRKLTKRSRYAVIKRGLTPAQQRRMNEAGIPGYSFIPDERRIYPHGRLFSHVVGFSGVDNEGLLGLERGLNGEITSDRVSDLWLSVDSRVQYILRDELLSVIEEYDAIGGAGIVMDVKTREILGMVSLPDFNPHEPLKFGNEVLFNRATMGVYELGSSFKIFNSALSLEGGRSMTEDFYDASRPLHVGGKFYVEDYHAQNRALNIAEIFIHSSNIGSALMAWESGAKRQRDLFFRLGFLTSVDSDYPELARPIRPKRWHRIETATMSFGHGISVTPLHLATATASIIGDGIYVAPRFTRLGADKVDKGVDVDKYVDVDKGLARNNNVGNDVNVDGEITAFGERVISPSTVYRMRELFRLNVLEGSGRLANVLGYRVGGKTGTAEKAIDGSYAEDRLIANFVAVFPMEEPRYVVFVMIDEPQSRGGLRPSGGIVAAPLGGRIIKRMAPVIGLLPDVEKEQLLDEQIYLPLLSDIVASEERLINISH